MLHIIARSRAGGLFLAVGLLICTSASGADRGRAQYDDINGFARGELKKEGVGLDDASLLKALDHKNGFIRHVAAETLGKRAMKVAIPTLTRMLADPSEVARLGAAEALLNMGDRSGIPALKSLLASKLPCMACSAAEVLASHGDDSGLDVARSFLTSTRPPERWAALKALGASANPAEYVPALKAALQDPFHLNRLAAVTMLQKKGTAQALALIADVVNSPDESLRRRAAGALNWCQKAEAIPHMIAALTNDNLYVRETVALGLAHYAGRTIGPDVKRQVRTIDGARAAQASYQQWWDQNKSTFDITKVGPMRFEDPDGE